MHGVGDIYLCSNSYNLFVLVQLEDHSCCGVWLKDQELLKVPLNMHLRGKSATYGSASIYVWLRMFLAIRRVMRRVTRRAGIWKTSLLGWMEEFLFMFEA